MLTFSIYSLVSQHSEFSARIRRCLQRCAELAVDVLEMESEMAVRCEPDRCGLDRLQETQDQLEVWVQLNIGVIDDLQSPSKNQKEDMRKCLGFRGLIH